MASAGGYTTLGPSAVELTVAAGITIGTGAFTCCPSLFGGAASRGDAAARIVEEAKRLGTFDELKTIWAANGADYGGMTQQQFGSIKPHTHFTGEIYVLSKDEGGRHTPFFNNYRPQFYFRTTDVTGAIELPEGKEMVMP
eukprot:gene44408-55224_t